MSSSPVDAPETLRLLADGHRWRIVHELGRSDRKVGELAELLDAPQNLVSYHLAQLRDGGLVTSRRSSADGRDTYYRVDLPRCGELLSDAAASVQPGLRLSVVPTDPGRRAPNTKPVVLFLCSGNSARSQMAEALLEHRSGYSIRARSAGSHPKPLHSNAVRVMAERGIDISGRTTKHLSRFARSRFDRVITLCDKVKEICPEFPGQPVTAHWSMADPGSAAGPGSVANPAATGDTDEASYPAFKHTAEELEVRVDFLIAELADARHERGSSRA